MAHDFIIHRSRNGSPARITCEPSHFIRCREGDGTFADHTGGDGKFRSQFDLRAGKACPKGTTKDRIAHWAARSGRKMDTHACRVAKGTA